MKYYLFLLFIFSCKTPQSANTKEERHSINFSPCEGCFPCWQYDALKQKDKIKVLLFAKEYHNSREGWKKVDIPSWLIGINQMGDTVALIDPGWGREIKKGMTIHVKPYNMSDSIKTEKLVYQFFGNVDDNLLLCNVKIAHYGKIRHDFLFTFRSILKI